MKSNITARLRELLKSTRPFDSLPDEVVDNLLPHVSIVNYSAGNVIIAQGSGEHPGLYIVESGTVRLMDVEAHTLIRKCSENDFFGAFGLLRGGTSIYEAKAVEPTVCALLDSKRFNKLYDEFEEFATHFDHDIERHVWRMNTHIDVGGAHLLFSRRLDMLPLRRPLSCTPDTSIQEAARQMTQQSAEALLVTNDDGPVGTVTDVDIRAKYAARGLSSDTAIKRIMSRPVVTIQGGGSLFDALMKMVNHRVNHLVLVEDEPDDPDAPELLAVLSTQDISHFRGKDPLATVHRIDHIVSVNELSSIREETGELLQSLQEQGVPPDQLTRLLASLYDRVAHRILELVEHELREAGSPKRVDLPWAWVRLGSGGRQEMMLTSEQNNALIYADPESDEQAEQAKAWFSALGTRTTEALETCGFPASELVAGKPSYCTRLSDWKRQFRTWIFEADREDIVASMQFFDLRGVHGDQTLVDELIEDVEDALNVQALDTERHMLQLLALHVLEHRAKLTMLERLKLPRTANGGDMYDLRERGILPVVEAARVLALDLRYFASTNTFDRLHYAAKALPDLRATLEMALEGYRHFADFRLEHQLYLIEGGEQPNDQLDVYNLSKMQQRLLQRAADAVADLQDAIARRYNLHRKA